MALGSTQLLVKMSTRNIPGGKGGRCVSLTSPHSRAECYGTPFLLYTTLHIYSVLSLLHMKVRDSDVLALSSRDDRAMTKYSTCTVQYHVSFKGWQNNKNQAFPSKPCTSNEKARYCYTFYNENHTYAPAKGKAVPLETWRGSEGFRKLRFTDFMTTAQDGGKVVSLTQRPPLPPGYTQDIHWFLLEAESTPGS
jgi:hypothetical protein